MEAEVASPSVDLGDDDASYVGAVTCYWYVYVLIYFNLKPDIDLLDVFVLSTSSKRLRRILALLDSVA